MRTFNQELQGPMQLKAEIGRYRFFSEGVLKVHTAGQGYQVTNGGYIEVDVIAPGFLDIETAPKVKFHVEHQRSFPFEPADAVPVEVPADQKVPETMEQKMIRYLGRMVAERYGSNSQELETYEEYTDFDLDEDEVSLSGFEVSDEEVVVGESTQSATDTTHDTTEPVSEEETSNSE